MVQQQQNSNTSAVISNVQNTALNAKDTIHSMELSPEQLEILQQCYEEKITNEQLYSSLLEPHPMMCNCVECN